MNDPEHPTAVSGFNGLCVAAFESRLGKEMSTLITRHGGHPFVAPSMKEVPLEDNPEAVAFGELLLAGHIDVVIFLTGVGTRCLMQVWKTKWEIEPCIQALRETDLVARGPKSVQALKEVGLTPSVVVPEPNTWEDLIQAMDETRPGRLKGMRVAVQEYGVTNPELLQALKVRGAEVIPVPVYRWALPDNLEPLKEVLKAIVEGRVHVVLFTNAAQVDHIFVLLSRRAQTDLFQKAVNKIMVASIGKITTERLKHYGLHVDLEPTHPKMGILVRETSLRAGEVLRMKKPD